MEQKQDSRVTVIRGFENLAESNRDFTSRTVIGTLVDGEEDGSVVFQERANAFC